MQPAGTVFIVDDDAQVRESLQALMESVGLAARTFPTAGEFREAYDHACPGCLVLDVRLPGMSGLELQRQLAAEGAPIPIIFISGYGDVATAAAALRRGALDFMEKPPRPQELLDCVQRALARDAENRRASAERGSVTKRLALLTTRERELANLVTTGLTNKQIAARLGVSSQSIDARRGRAMDKLQVGNLAKLVKLMLKAETTR